MGEAKQREERRSNVSYVEFSPSERVLLVKLMAESPPKDALDRKARKKATRPLFISGKDWDIEWTGAGEQRTGFFKLKAHADAVKLFEVTGEVAEYLLGFLKDKKSEAWEQILDIEERLEAVKDGKYVTPDLPVAGEEPAPSGTDGG